MDYKRVISVLVIEDNKIEALLIKENLTDSLFKLHFATTLSESKAYFEQGINYDAILLDLTLPDSQGIDTFYAIYSIVPHIPIIILSGLNDENVVFATLQKGAQDYLFKGDVNKNILQRSIRYSIERKQIDTNLKEALDLNQKIFSASSFGILTYKASGKCIFANETASKILNATVDKLLEQNFHHIKSWKSSTLYDSAVAVIETNKPVQKEFNLNTTFGVDVWLDCYLATFSTLGETNLLLIFNDKTKKKLIEKDLEWKNYLMEMLLQHSPDAIYFKDLYGRITDISKAFADKLGFDDVKNVIGKTDFDLFSPQHANQAFSDEQKIIDSREGLFNFEEIETFENKPNRWVISSKMPLIDLNGKIIGTFGVSRDITEQKKSEEALLLSKSQLAEAMDVAQIYQWAFDIKTGNFVFNRKFWKLLGKDENEKPYSMSAHEFSEDFIHCDDKHIFENEIKKAYKTIDSDFYSQVEYRIRVCDGSTRYLMARTRTEFDCANATSWLFGIFQDITDKTIAIQRSLEALNKIDSVKTDFLTFISQELRTPLNGIVGAISLIKNQDNSSAIKDLVGILDNSVSNLEFFTENVTYFSRLSNNYKLDSCDLDFVELLQFSIMEKETTLNEKKISIDLEKRRSMRLNGDKDLLFNVLLNVFQIFIDISKKNQTISIDFDDDEKLICIFNNKEAIFPEELLKSFSSILEIPTNHRDSISLFLIKKIMDMHNGEMQILNVLNYGAVIKLIFSKPEFNQLISI